MDDSFGSPFELAIAFSRHLGRADRCRLVDQMMAELGPMAPIPETEDVTADAQDWASSVPDAVRRAYLIELFCQMPEDRQSQFIEWAGRNKKGPSGKS